MLINLKLILDRIDKDFSYNLPLREKIKSSILQSIVEDNMTPVVQSLLDDLKTIEELHRRKNDDYAAADNPFSNFDVSEYGLRLFTNPRDQSFVWPIFTKLARLSTLLNSDKTPNNESVEDTMIDIAVYMLLWKADLKRRNEPLILQTGVEE